MVGARSLEGDTLAAACRVAGGGVGVHVTTIMLVADDSVGAIMPSNEDAITIDHGVGQYCSGSCQFGETVGQLIHEQLAVGFAGWFRSHLTFALGVVDSNPLRSSLQGEVARVTDVCGL